MTAAAETVPGEPPHAHHWSPVNAYHGAKLGMWLFLATELLLFGVLFTSFAIYRYTYLGEFHDASLKLDWKLGAINTAVLILSSFTAALAMDAAQRGNNKRVKNLLLFTVACGGIFLVVKYFEYSHKYEIGLFPGVECPVVEAGDAHHGDAHHGAGGHHQEYCWPKDTSALSAEQKEMLVSNKYKMYFGLYYCMTALHALHVIIGMGLLSWVCFLAARNRFSEQYYTPVELGALYWHLVDLIWIYLFPLLYLVD
ncbi:cytochrome c oxidase subunit 3 family protein [bacterium]|nr:cytochrome c oxidase subunit 3 family protein [bacterium]